MILSNTRDPERHASVNPVKTLTRRGMVSGTAKLVGVAIAITSLNGCLMTSPYWNQEVSSRTAKVPLQAFTTKKDYTVKYECAQAYHGGLYPTSGSATWVLIDTVNPLQQSLKDSYGAKVYGAGIKRVLPASCWRQDPANSVWYSSVRATQVTNTGTVSYQNFNKSGLECLGTEVGKATSWFGWLNKGCISTYSGSTTAIPYVIFRSAS